LLLNIIDQRRDVRDFAILFADESDSLIRSGWDKGQSGRIS